MVTSIVASPSEVLNSAVSLLKGLSQSLRPTPNTPSPTMSSCPRHATCVRWLPVTEINMLVECVG